MLEELLQDELVETFQWPRFYPIQLSSSINPVTPPTGGMLSLQVIEARDLVWSKDIIEETVVIPEKQSPYIEQFDDWKPFEHPLGFGAFVSKMKSSRSFRDDMQVLSLRKPITHGITLRARGTVGTRIMTNTCVLTIALAGVLSYTAFRTSNSELEKLNIKPKNVSEYKFEGKASSLSFVF